MQLGYVVAILKIMHFNMRLNSLDIFRGSNSVISNKAKSECSFPGLYSYIYK